MKICEKCETPLDPTTRARKYCSAECRKQVKYKKDRAWFKANPGKANEYSRKWRRENAELVRQMGRDAYRKKCLAKIEAEITHR